MWEVKRLCRMGDVSRKHLGRREEKERCDCSKSGSSRRQARPRVGSGNVEGSTGVRGRYT